MSLDSLYLLNLAPLNYPLFSLPSVSPSLRSPNMLKSSHPKKTKQNKTKHKTLSLILLLSQDAIAFSLFVTGKCL